MVLLVREKADRGAEAAFQTRERHRLRDQEREDMDVRDYDRLQAGRPAGPENEGRLPHAHRGVGVPAADEVRTGRAAYNRATP